MKLLYDIALVFTRCTRQRIIPKREQSLSIDLLGVSKLKDYRFNQQDKLLSLFYRWFVDQSSWVLPVLYMMLSDLRDLAEQVSFVDRQRQISADIEKRPTKQSTLKRVRCPRLKSARGRSVRHSLYVLLIGKPLYSSPQFRYMTNRIISDNLRAKNQEEGVFITPLA